MGERDGRYGRAPEAQPPSPPPGQVNKAAAAEARAHGAGRPEEPTARAGEAEGSAARAGEAPGRRPAPVPGRGPDGTGPPGQGAKKSVRPRTVTRGHSQRHPSSEPADGSSDPGGSPAEPGGAGSPDEPGRSPSADEPDVTGGIDLPRAEDVDGDGGQEADVAGPVASETVELPEDASPETLPFTGLGLAFITLGGLVALAGGLMLRRAATR